MTKKYEHLGRILKKLLFDKNMRAADLAREANLPVTTVHRIITGKSTRPYPSTLETIAKYFGKSVEDLKNESNDKSLLSKIVIKDAPLVEWDNIKNKIVSTTFPVHNISDTGFALKMNDSSMEPLFPKDSILIFEPQYNSLLDRSYMLIKLAHSTTHVFRQVLIVDNKQYIQALNPEIREVSLKELTTSDLIIAKLIESRTIQ